MTFQANGNRCAKRNCTEMCTEKLVMTGGKGTYMLSQGAQILFFRKGTPTEDVLKEEHPNNSALAQRDWQEETTPTVQPRHGPKAAACITPSS